MPLADPDALWRERRDDEHEDQADDDEHDLGAAALWPSAAALRAERERHAAARRAGRRHMTYADRNGGGRLSRPIRLRRHTGAATASPATITEEESCG